MLLLLSTRLLPNPAYNSSTGTVSSSRPVRILALAPSATSATALSAAGWALTTLPASVLELRIWLDPTMEEGMISS